MQTFNIHQAKTQLSRLVERASKGEAFIIARAGKPMVKVVPLEEAPAPGKTMQKLGFLEGQFKVPDDFDTMFQDEIEAMFYGES